MPIHSKLFVLNENVVIKIYYFRYMKCFHWVDFSYNVSLRLICIFIIIFIFCRFRLVSPRSYIVTLTPTLNKFRKQTNKAKFARPKNGRAVCPGLMLQLSMDGPSINWRVFDLLNSFRREKEWNDLLNFGSCGLHAIHDAFQTGVKARMWDIKKF